MNLIAAIRREYIYLSTILRTLSLLGRLKPDATCTIVDVVEEWARKTPNAPAILYLDSVMSYAELNARANRYAHWALSLGLKQGDPVALFMENRPDFLCAWLGLFKAGLCAAISPKPIRRDLWRSDQEEQVILLLEPGMAGAVTT